MVGDAEQEQDDPDPEFVEVDPTGRYGRYAEVLGKGAFKFVYKAFDTLEGIEVAWNQMKVRDVSQDSDDLEPLFSEVHLLQTLKHKNIIKFYCSWVDLEHGNINFITEIFTSGNLRQYREKHRHVEVRALKNWARQILQGLNYLHSHDPPVIHRDLKCDNIFVNGNHGEVKIGDLGLAALLCNSQSATRVIGTPEFMAPELYSENYNELVDIYAFGMCLLELMTFEYPYKECRNVAQIYKKVTSGIKPASLGKVADLGVKMFIEKCIADASKRLPARELLMDPFLQLDVENNSIPYSLHPHISRIDDDFDQTDAYCSTPTLPSQDFTVQGQGKDVNIVFLKLRVADSKGHFHNINFPFDIKEDTSITVASEMVAELDLTDQDVIALAEMIDSQVQAYVPDWSRGEYGDYDDDTSPMDDVALPMGDVTSPMDGVEHETEADEASVFSVGASHSSDGHFLEQLPFGPKYWSDSPKGSSGSSLTSSPTSVSSGSDAFVSSHHSIEVNEKESSPSMNANSLDNPHGNMTFVMHRTLDNLHMGVSTLFSEPNKSSPAHIDTREHEVSEKNICWWENIRDGIHVDQNSWSNTSLLVNTKTEMKDEPDDIKVLVERLGYLLIEQQKEVCELKAKHAQSITSIMKGLPPQLHSKILRWCQQELPDQVLSNERFLHRTRSGKLRSISAQYALPSYVLHSHTENNLTAKYLATQTDGGSDSFFTSGETIKKELLLEDRKGGFVSRISRNKVNLNFKCSDVGIGLILRDD